MSGPAVTGHDQALHEAAAALAAVQDILGLQEPAAHLVEQAQHLVRLAQRSIDRAIFLDWN